MAEAAVGPELVIGLVGATGTDLEAVSNELDQSLRACGYQSDIIRLVHLLRDFRKWAALPTVPEDERIRGHMDAGDEFRRITRYPDAFARLGILAIVEHRHKLTGSETEPAQRRAFILRSLKRPEEVEALREVYGASFVLVGAYSPRGARVARLASRISASHSSVNADGFRSAAEALVKRDLDDEEQESGQRVGEVFPLADFFVNANDRAGLRTAVDRTTRLIFGYPFSTPTRDECGMFFAHAAALRSGSLSRQVGAAICTTGGDIVAVGTNEVPRAGGGSYWEGDDDDQRDHVAGSDSSDLKKRVMAAEVLGRLNTAGWLSENHKSKSPEDLAAMALDDGVSPVLRNTQLMRVVEYVRAVHAEMSAITDAARRGTSVRDCTLYATTFPCHHCARHIVASGIRRVVYVEPYPKSLATELHRDSIEMEPEREPAGKVAFEPFVGVAPRQYSRMFSMNRRKDRQGHAVRWDGASAVPRYAWDFASYGQAETVRLKELADRLTEIGLSSTKEESGD